MPSAGMPQTARTRPFPDSAHAGRAAQTPGKPKLTFRGRSLNEIPGVQKGFGTVESMARKNEADALKSLFAPGDRVKHPKFGNGTVTDVRGSGKDARIRIRFSDGSDKELALAIAPIVRTEED